jgi:sulfate permease, SulP family
VISGFVTASGILIAGSQLGHIFGIQGGHNLIEMGANLISQFDSFNPITFAIEPALSCTCFCAANI